MKVNCDLQLTVMGSSLYRLFGAHIGGAHTSAESRHIWREFINALSPRRHHARHRRRPLRYTSPQRLPPRLADTETPVPWWQGRKLKLYFG
jgi:hypothetical protein